ncbi:hypothetical protein GMOD_00008721 [Pyrenophora seminiperda CCB06]|uniref:Uncharacterized protein n=1 Tax=Pyrenophora seminiperda CCB06 TaxID=1302712 RepID=A0A3M7M5X7_9PLEO|nr:hypothetical protein GMOD_00008721 [Pyrenophora seminiperda CCB06]
MAATTRARTGNSKPRLLTTLASTLAPSTTTSSTRTPKTKTKANTSKPRSATTTKKVSTGRVSKSTTAKKTKTPTAAAANVKMVKKPRTKTEKVVDAVAGTAEKVVGDLTGKSGKKAAGTRKARGTDRVGERVVV